MSTRQAPASRSRFRVHELSFRNWRLAVEEMMRLMIRLPSSQGGTPCSFRMACTGEESGRWNTASTLHCCSPDRMSVLSARSPSARRMAPMMTDLPAPVSPVMQMKPELGSQSSWSTRARFLIFSNVSIRALDFECIMASFALNAIMTSVMNILFLGTGTSTGVPQIGCSCAVCTSPDPRNKRLRSSVYVEAAGTRILLDSSPDLRQQALRENITDVDAVLYTHAHVDHVGGFDDLRAFCWRRSGGLPLYASPQTMEALRTMYGWAFEPKTARSGYVRPEPHEVTEPFRVGNVLVTPLPVMHAGVETYAYVLEAEGQRLAYMPDVKSIPEASLEAMKGVDLLIIDGLRYHLHPTHLCLEESLAAIAAIRPGRAVLTHMSHDMDYGILSGKLPENVMPAYDGLRLSLP